MKQRFNRWINALTGILMSWLGFTACDWIIGGTTLCEYGQPNANYKLVGAVKDKAGKPVKGIRVVFNPNDDNLYGPEYYRDTLYSDSEGRFSADLKYDWPSDLNNAVVVFDDIDGEENGGEFASRTLKKGDWTMKQTQKGSGNWYEGEYEITADVSLDQADKD